MKVMDIAEVAEHAGVPPSALRYYEEIGLIESVGRHGLRRQFGPETLLRLSLIALGKLAGFSLTEIARVFGPDGQPSLPRPEIRARADELDRQIQNLTTLRNLLRHVADCPEPNHLDCPKFQRLLRMAGRHGAKVGAGKRKRMPRP
ncbi:MAG: helix-turn-helix domain-containing protein [Pseudomonadota bacterium]